MRFLLLTHLLCGVCAAAAAIHAFAFGSISLDARRTRRLGGLVVVLTLAAVTTGVLLYPDYKVHIRGPLLEVKAPWAARLFDLKEQLVVIAVPLLGGYFLRGPTGASGKALSRLMTGAVALLLVSAVLLALYVEKVHAWGHEP
ncbi:MAG: hypothetical protein EXR76_11460 [Myxococcales bacterium]|nr:hypothetical protein [Myxococcales bacterium]